MAIAEQARIQAAMPRLTSSPAPWLEDPSPRASTTSDTSPGFVMPDFEFSCFANPAGNVLQWNFSDNS